MSTSHAAFVVVAGLLAGLAACSLEERADFLIGRICNREDPRSCDEGQECLPHTASGPDLDDFRCRDLASFAPIEGREAPLAYCDPEDGITCPAGLVCNADRVRLDATTRRLVCKPPDDVFAPPWDGGAP